MNIDFEKIKTIYGEEIIKNIVDNKEEIQKNINYLYYLNFNDVENIFERTAPLFIDSNKTFKNKIDNLINRIGNNYVEEIENNLGLLEDLL
jgi:hypothetical protein